MQSPLSSWLIGYAITTLQIIGYAITTLQMFQHPKFDFTFDGMNAVTGPYARKVTVYPPSALPAIPCVLELSGCTILILWAMP